MTDTLHGTATASDQDTTTTTDIDPALRALTVDNVKSCLTQVDDAECHVEAGVERQTVLRGGDGVGVIVDAEHGARTEALRGDGQDAGAATNGWQRCYGPPARLGGLGALGRRTRVETTPRR